MTTPSSKSPPENSAQSVAETILSWGDVGFQVPKIRAYVYPVDGFYHGGLLCSKVSFDNNSFTTVGLNDIRLLMEADSFCNACASWLEFESATSSSLSFKSIDHLVGKIRKVLKLELTDVSVKGIGKALPQRRYALDVIEALKVTFTLPGAIEVEEAMNAKLQTFDDQVKAFRESPEGLRQILKYAARDIFTSSAFTDDSLWDSLHGMNGKAALKETKRLKKSLQKSIERVVDAPVYSLCSHPYFERTLPSASDGSISSSLNRLISDKWLKGGKSVVLLPYIVALYTEARRINGDFSVLHLDEKPTDRLIECVEAFYSTKDGSLSLLEAYKAAVAID